VEMEVAYGPAKDDLSYLLKYGSSLQVAFSKQPVQKNTHTIVAGTSVTKYEHDRA